MIEADGGHLIPGLRDRHTHSVAEADWHFPLFLAFGVTGIRNMNDGTGDVDDIRNTRRISAVVADGRLYRRADLDRHLAGVDAPGRQE